MALPKYYNAGTVSVASGATAVTGTGTAWKNVVKADDVLRVGGYSVRIASVTDNTHLTLAEAWPDAPLTDDPYEIAITYDGPEFQLRTRELLENIRDFVEHMASIAEAEAANPVTAPNYIQTAGFAAAGDGGGALYKAVGSEPSHEGKFSITLADAVTVQWYELAETEPNVKMFGAVGGGDHTSACQAACDAFLNIKFPAGSYNLTAPIELRSNANVRGAGREVTFISAEGCTAFTSPASNQRVHISDMSIYGDSTAITYGIQAINNPRGFVAERLFIYGFGTAGDGAGILLDGTTDLNMWGALLSEVNTEGCGRGIVTLYDAATTIQSCISRLNKGDPLYCEESIQQAIIGGTFENSNAAHGASSSIAMNFKNCQGTSIHGTYTENCIDGAIKLDGCFGFVGTGVRTGSNTSTSAREVQLINSSHHNVFVGCVFNGLYNVGITGIYVDASSAYNAFINCIVEEDGTATGTAVNDLGSNNSLEVTVGASGTRTSKHPATTFAGLNLPAGGAINWASGGITQTESSDTMVWAGASSYRYDASVQVLGSSSFFEAMKLQSTNADANGGPYLVLERLSASPAASDNLATLQYNGRDDGSNLTTYAEVGAQILDPANGSEDGAYYVKTMVAGSTVTAVQVANGMIVGAPTGSFKGTGTINATAVYDDNSLLTCMALTQRFMEEGYVDTEFWDSLVPPLVIPARVERRAVMEEYLDESSRMVPDGAGGFVISQEPKLSLRQVVALAPIRDANGNGIGAVSEPIFEQVTIPEEVIPRRHELAHLFKAMVEDGFDPRDPAAYVAKLKSEEALPGMPTKEAWRHGGLSTGELVGRLWLATEMLALVVMNLNDRVTSLEATRPN